MQSYYYAFCKVFICEYYYFKSFEVHLFIGGDDVSDALQEVKVPLVSRKECSAVYDPEGPEDNTHDILDSQICAGIITRDSCQVNFI